MTEEQIFKNLFPEYCVGEECLSPYFDLFQIGFEEGENQNKELQEENARLKKESEENQDLATIAYMQGASKNKAKLDEAKRIIKEYVRLANLEKEDIVAIWQLYHKAETFLKECGE